MNNNLLYSINAFMQIVYPLFESLTLYWVFSHDVMAAIFVSQNNEAAAMFVSQTSPVGS